jgi:predicted  nucleic acid-binding Zn-ribbon protein
MLDYERYNRVNYPIIDKIKKTKKQKEKIKQYESQLKILNKKVGVIEKEIEKFKGQHQKIFNILDKLNTKSENACEKYVKKMTQLNDYKEKFIVRDTQRDCVA